MWSTSLAPTSWSNGVVMCEFQSNSPSVAVSALQVTNSGLSVGVGEIQEMTPVGNVVAVAPLESLGWNSRER